ncbi:MAG: hypothetical protein M9894_05065 [Planctomycetes bacterium]|nr:hypothetical protein [Planctomycetota bacterium]
MRRPPDDRAPPRPRLLLAVGLALVVAALALSAAAPLRRSPPPADDPAAPDALPLLPPGAATPEVLAACRALLGAPRVYEGADLDALDPALGRLAPERVVVGARAVFVELDPISTLVALAEGAHWRDVEPFVEPMAVDELLDGLWLVTPW